MYILTVTILSVVMLAYVHYLAYQSLLETILVAFLLFTAMDTALRAILNEPSWIIKVGIIKKKKQ